MPGGPAAVSGGTRAPTIRIVGAVVIAGLALGAAAAVCALDLKRSGGAYWVSGGVGADERDEMVLALPDYNLKILTAAEQSGAFLSAVAATVRDAQGRIVLETSLDGPWLLARLDPGRYEITATWGGRSQTRGVTIPPVGRRELFLYWPAPGIETLPPGALK